MSKIIGRMRGAVVTGLAVIAAACGSATYGQQSEGAVNRPPELRSRGAEVTQLEIAQGSMIEQLAIRNQTGRVRSSWYFRDPDGDDLTYTVEPSADFAWLKVSPVRNGELFSLSGTPGNGDVGGHEVAFTITAFDGMARASDPGHSR